MPNTTDRKVGSKGLNNFFLMLGGSNLIVLAYIIYSSPSIMNNNKEFWEQTSKDRETLEKYAIQVKNGEPLTIQQGIEFIIQEHDNNKDGKISITEAMDVLGRIKRYENRTYKGWNESGKNLYKSLLEIDNEQSKK